MTELIRRLDRDRFRVHVACFHRDGAWLPRVVERAESVVEFPIAGFARPHTLVELVRFARWCRQLRIAVVQTCDLYANTFGLPGAMLAGVPVRIGSRRELNPDKPHSLIRLQRQAYRSATTVVANSPAAASMLRDEGLATGSIAVIQNGVDHGQFRERDRTGHLRTIITVANLRPEKSHETLIGAAALLTVRHPELRYQFVGDGPQRQQLEALVAAHGLSDRISFLGHREDVPALLAAADLFVLPSRSEALPNGAIEAMTAGLPVVASAVGGLIDLIEDGRTGRLVAPGRPEALASAIADLAGDPATAAALGSAARAAAVRRFSFDRMVAAFEDVYVSGLLGGASTRAQRAQAAGV